MTGAGEPAAAVLLNVRDLRYGYGVRRVLESIDMTVAAGEVVSLVGPNGAGKSTLLRCLNGILRPSSGAIALDGRDVGSYSRRALARAIAYVPQQQGPAISLSVVDMITLGRAPHRGYGTRKRDRELVLDMVEQLGLHSLALRSFATLSGGERQRVLLARALVQAERMLLLDEPTSALDLKHQLDTLSIVRTFAKSRGRGVLIAIHDLALASRFSDRVVMLDSGRMHTSGPWQDVVAARHLEAVYDVSAIIGCEQDLPYIIPVQRDHRAGSDQDR